MSDEYKLAIELTSLLNQGFDIGYDDLIEIELPIEDDYIDYEEDEEEE